MVAALTAYMAGYSVPGMGYIIAGRTFDTLSVQSGQSATVTFELELDEDELDPINGFYYADHIPSGLTVTRVFVRLDGVSLDLEDYTSETEWEGAVYPGCATYRWVLDTPDSFDDHSVGESVVIQYEVESDVAGSYTFPDFNWVGDIGGSSAFGYDEGDPPVLEVEGTGGEEPFPEPAVYGTPLLTALGLGMLVLLLAVSALLKSGTKAAGHD